MNTDASNGSPLGGEPAPKKSRKKVDAELGNETSETLPDAAEQEVRDNIEQEADHLDELAKALAEADELRDRYLRLKAEWDNYRKRTDAERADERSRATQRLVEKILPVLDDMERATEHSDSAQEQSLRDGIVQVYTKLQSVLESEGVKVIDPKGEPFDANLHCALSKVEEKKLPDDTVLEVFQKGYLMGGRVLRPASVVVSCR